MRRAIFKLYNVKMYQYGVAGIITLEYLGTEFAYLDANLPS